MSLPHVTVTARPGEAPLVLVDGSALPGVRWAQITVTADGVPQVSVMLTASAVDLDLPAGVTALRAGPSATEFARGLSPARLEQDALERLDDDVTQGEAFKAAVSVQAALVDDRG